MKKYSRHQSKKLQDRSNFDVKTHFQKADFKLKDGVFIYTGSISVKDFCQKIGVSVSDLIKKTFLKGKFYNINSTLEEAEIGELCLEYGLDFQKKEIVDEINIIESIKFKDQEKDLVPRPPVITIMGHVDHGKTTLLDTIRKTKIAQNEIGKITQHIGAYQVKHNQQKITFIDTPGHEAFVKMRQQGTMVTDIIIIVVSAVDGVKPQTLEAKEHALNSKKPIIVAINKIDLAHSNPQKIINELTKHGLVPEALGGNVIFKNISALKGDGIDDLLDTILTIAEVEELKANPKRYAIGSVLESYLDQGLGPVATILVENGTLKKGDPIVIGSCFGKIRQMITAKGKVIKIALPSTPVKITGLTAIPQIGVRFMAFANEKEAKKIAYKRKKDQTQKSILHSQGKTMADLEKKLSESKLKQLNLIIKTDVFGSIAAIEYSLAKIKVPNTKINIINSNVGAISNDDVTLAKIADAHIFTFNIKSLSSIINKAKEENIRISNHNVIYHLQNEVKDILESFHFSTLPKFTISGKAKVIAIFKIPEVGVIVGSKVESGQIKKTNTIALFRNKKELFKGKITSMKIKTNDVNKAQVGEEVGLSLNGFAKAQVGDNIEFYEELKPNN